MLDQAARQSITVVISAKFSVGSNAEIRVADEQAPIRDVDEYFGSPGQTSVRYEADVILEKPFVDVLINGAAYSPGGSLAERVMVSASLGSMHKQLVVTGDRFWMRGLRSGPSSPQPFVKMELIYERAYGGAIKGAADHRNPIGVGFQGARSHIPEIGTEVPNTEYPSMMIRSPRDHPEPAAFGIVARNWMPRIGLAGTFDDAWQGEQWPLLPTDFDNRFFQAAPTDQQLQSVTGGEVVDVRNMTPDGQWTFRLPALAVPVRLLYSSRTDSADLVIDTVLLEPELHRVSITARKRIVLRPEYGPLEEVVFGEPNPGWWRSRVVGKRYLDWARTEGGARGFRYFL